MAVADIDELVLLARESFDKARKSATRMGLRRFSEVIKAAMSVTENYARLMATEPEFDEIEPYEGITAYAAILSFDLRRSSERAIEIGPRDTYITMHTFLPTMLAIVNYGDGLPVGLRGDDAIACFGLVDTDKNKRVTNEQCESAVRLACRCGDAIVRAVDSVVNPVLIEGGIKVGLMVGVGIDIGDIVATNIGLGNARDLTAYGNCVNKACKNSFGNNVVYLTHKARLSFPKSEGGRTRFHKHHDPKKDAYRLEYPPDFHTLN